MIICLCNNITSKELKQAIEMGADTLEALQKIYGVGRICGSCKITIKDILKGNKNGYQR